MSNERFENTIGKVGHLVNGLAIFVTVGLIGIGYFNALGSFAGMV